MKTNYNFKTIAVVYEAVGPYDTTEGRTPGTISYGFFSSYDDAADEAKDKGVMGTLGEVKPRLALILDDGSLFPFATNTPLEFAVGRRRVEDLRKSGLAKLTLDERKALGF